MSESAIAECENVTLQLGGLSEAVLSEIVSQLESKSEINQDSFTELQQCHPNLRFTLCYEQEMGANDAYIEANGFDVHLVSHSLSGCSSLTDNLAQSTGLVIALHDE